jgi:hypothetical protein
MRVFYSANGPVRRTAEERSQLELAILWVAACLSRVFRKRPARFGGGCALQVHTVQPPEMAALTKPSQQSGTESCVGSGNEPGEA